MINELKGLVVLLSAIAMGATVSLLLFAINVVAWNLDPSIRNSVLPVLWAQAWIGITIGWTLIMIVVYMIGSMRRGKKV